VVVLLLLAGAGVLATLPFGAGAMRVGGLSLLWWYAVVGGPLAAAAVTTGALASRPLRSRHGSATTPAA
jgi:hypothetical protein